MLQQRYCQHQKFFWVGRKCDNPDQRITQDVNLFCQRLASIALVIAAIPFQAIYYTFWTYQITSGYVVLAVYTFFLVSLLLERLVLHLFWLFPTRESVVFHVLLGKHTACLSPVDIALLIAFYVLHQKW